MIGYRRDVPWRPRASPAEASAGKWEVVNKGFLVVLVVSVALVHLEETAIQGGFFLCYRIGRCDCRRHHFGVAFAPGVPEGSSAFAHTGGVLGGLPARAPARLRDGLHRRSSGVGHQGSGLGGGSSLHRLVTSCSPCPPVRPDRARRSIAPPRVRWPANLPLAVAAFRRAPRRTAGSVRRPLPGPPGAPGHLRAAPS